MFDTSSNYLYTFFWYNSKSINFIQSNWATKPWGKVSEWLPHRCSQIVEILLSKIFDLTFEVIYMILRILRIPRPVSSHREVDRVG